ncbi:hypothetical protein N1495_01040 [Streptococcus didelphis]|uniref:Uncharacterized protein n=1 Tax=Streptococcus didelphis TaxID=102886 RepID=A0ABY9LGJ6_9STRE|nr:DUF4298 domain-containing protein [Streptococcus didelphis]WMB27883.1 hypothetical protein N1496_07530 [Streptococcus didelphis]WMB29645.1 hypothetical protein N1495_01040 [Streptococcus didelphis]
MSKQELNDLEETYHKIKRVMKELRSNLTTFEELHSDYSNFVAFYDSNEYMI